MAAARPDRLVVGIDPVATAMAEASRRACAPTRKGGLPNAVFVVASAEALPAGLEGIAELVTVNLPWGSLLRGALGVDGVAARGIASLVAPGGRVEMLLAPSARDGLGAEVDVEARLADGLASCWAEIGLDLVGAGPAGGDALAAIQTTWARRLRISSSAGASERVAWRLELRRR